MAVSAAIDRARLRALMDREGRSFVEAHPRSRALFDAGRPGAILWILLVAFTVSSVSARNNPGASMPISLPRRERKALQPSRR